MWSCGFGLCGGCASVSVLGICGCGQCVRVGGWFGCGIVRVGCGIVIVWCRIVGVGCAVGLAVRCCIIGMLFVVILC